MSYRALSPSLGDQEFPMKQLLFLPVWVGLQTKRGLVLHLASAPAGYEGTGAGAAVWVQVWSLQGTNITYTTCLLFTLEFA